MKQLLYSCSVLCFILFTGAAGAQTHYADKKYYLIDSLDKGKLTKQDAALIDSCLKIYHAANADTVRISMLKILAHDLTDTATWYAYNRLMYSEAKGDLNNTGNSSKVQKRLYALAGSAATMLAYYYHYILDKPQAAELYNFACIDYFTKAGLKAHVASGMTDLAANYEEEGRIKEAVQLYQDGLKLMEEEKDTNNMIVTYQNIGNVLRKQEDIKGALPYFRKSLVLATAKKSMANLAAGLNFLAICYKEMQRYDSALDIYNKALAIYDSLHNEYGKATILLNEGIIYQNTGNLDKALSYYQQSLEKFERSGDKNAIVFALNSIAIVYMKKENYPEAIKVGERSMEMAKEISYPYDIMNAAQLLSRVYKLTGRYKEALDMSELFKNMSDSIINTSTKRDAIEKDVKYQHEKELMKVQQEKEKEEIKAEQEQAKRNIIIASVSGVGLLLLAFSIFLYNRFRIIRKQKVIIERQKEEVEKKNGEIEEKNKDILDSITYAKRLQDAILPPLSIIQKYLPESFVLYKPKDIVAGDFYWMEQAGDNILIAAADCTGHGVPGAMVSVVCSNALNRTVKEFKITEPGMILDKVRELVIETFAKSESEVKDGMDISLCCINTKTKEIQWSGAYNPLWFVRNNELIEVAPDKQPIGVHDNVKPFNTHSLKLNKGDILYLFTDGYADQFGGEKGKKFKYKQFQEKLLSISSQSMEHQKQMLDETIESWRGNLEQIDDILVIGIRV